MALNCSHVDSIDYERALKKIRDPRKWHCDWCEGNTESVWMCLTCASVGCGRTCRQRHAHIHYSYSKHPLVIHINNKSVYCYVCDDWTLNDTPQGEIELLRLVLTSMQEPNFPSSSPVGSDALKDEFKFVGCEKEDQINDKEFTAQRLYARKLMRKCFTAIRYFKSNDEKQAEVQKSELYKKRLDRLILNDMTRKFRGRCGLRNLGNSCYVNAVIQALFQVPRFRDLVINLPDITRIEDSSDDEVPSESAGEIRVEDTVDVHDSSLAVPAFDLLPLMRCSSETLHREAQSRGRRVGFNMSMLIQTYKLFRVMWSGKWAGVSPTQFFKSVMDHMQKFRGYRQQDAHEFCISFLERMAIELTHLQRFGTLILKQSKQRWHDIQTQIANRPYASFVRKSFEILQISEIKCDVCSTSSRYQFPPANAVTLDLAMTIQRLESSSTSTSSENTSRRKSRRSSTQEVSRRHALHFSGVVKSCTLLDLLDDFVAPVRLTGNSTFYCLPCGTKRDASKQEAFVVLSDVMVLHVNRALWDQAGKSKLMHHLEFPLRNLDMGPYLKLSSKRKREDVSTLYTLSAAVFHHGSDIDQGHYTCLARTADHLATDSWILFNDLKTEYMGDDDIRNIQGQAYLLLYERSQSESNS